MTCLCVCINTVEIGTKSNLCTLPSTPFNPSSSFSNSVAHSHSSEPERRRSAKAKEGSQFLLKPRRRRKRVKLKFCLAAESSRSCLVTRTQSPVRLYSERSPWLGNNGKTALSLSLLLFTHVALAEIIHRVRYPVKRHFHIHFTEHFIGDLFSPRPVVFLCHAAALFVLKVVF